MNLAAPQRQRGVEHGGTFNANPITMEPGALHRTEAFAASLLKPGIVLSPNGLGCVSIPMDPATVDAFVSAAAGALAEVYG